jgi:PAS domain S-box-containing protein
LRFSWSHTGFAALALAAATAARWIADPFLGSAIPYAFIVVAVVLIAWRTTTPYAIAAGLAGWAVASYLFVDPRHTFYAADPYSTIAYFTVIGSIILIADRMRRARVAAERSERQLEMISHRLPALVSLVSPDGRYVWCNDEYTRWFGLARERIIGRPVAEVVGTEAWHAIEPHLASALAGNNVEYEAESPYAHGGPRWVHVTYAPHRDEAGQVQGVVSMVTDIGDRKRAELNASLLADLSLAFATLPTAEDAARQVTERLVHRLGLSRCLLAEIDDATDSVHIFHHYSRDPEPSQVGDYTVSDFLTDAEQAQLSTGQPLVINDVREGRSPEAAERFLKLGVGAVVSAPYVTEGRRRFALAAEKREPYRWKPEEVELLGEVSARIYVQLDRARAEQTLRQSELRYRSLAAVLTNVPCIVDPVGRFLAPQPAWNRYTGQSFEQSRDFGWFDAVHPEDREPARQAWTDALHARKPYEVRVRLWNEATRDFRHVIARAVPLLDATGMIREWVGACTDIHEETEQARALLEADRRKDEFLATLAHELRNPLAPIRNGLHIMKLTGKAEGAVANVYQMLDRQVNHLVRLVDDLMEVSRITRGRVELRKEHTDVQAVIHTAIETSRPYIDEAGHRLELSLPAEPLRIEGDMMRLAQVITNLLNNAAKYTDRGGRILLTARREGSAAVISVRDNGRGISADMLPRVFDLFAQAAPGHDYSRGGLGIGLTLVRNLVDLHGGSVEARSEGAGRGSEFVVRLPLELAAGGLAETAPGTGAALPSRRVLVVDDNRDAADSLGVLLTLLGVETRTAHDGIAALEALDEFEPSVVLLDLAMPVMDGYEVAQRMRQHPHGRHVTLVAVTGWSLDRDRLRSAAYGFDGHLVKPVDVDVLRKLLADLPPAVGMARRA